MEEEGVEWKPCIAVVLLSFVPSKGRIDRYMRGQSGSTDVEQKQTIKKQLQESCWHQRSLLTHQLGDVHMGSRIGHELCCECSVAMVIGKRET